MPINTLPVGPGKLTIGAQAALTNFQSQCTSAKLVPSTDKGEKKIVLSGEEKAGNRKESFTLEGTFLQDFGAAGSTTEWLYNHAGEEHVFEYVPSTAKGKGLRGTLVVEAIDIGGDVGEDAESDFKFECIGRPVIASPTAKN